MLFNAVALLTAASMASAAAVPLVPRIPIENRAAVTDADILQYALTLEHLENAFYKGALSKWTLEAFVAQGGTADFYNQLKYVAHDEEDHVLFLTAGLTEAGAKPVERCTYNFGNPTVQEFIATAAVVEGLGVSAYLGGAPLISSKAYLTAAGAILVTEAIHQSALRNANKQIPMANPYGTPLGLNPVFSVASGFIVNCPSTNAPLPVKQLPALKLFSGLPTAAGAEIAVQPATAPPAGYFVTFVSGLTVTSVRANSFENTWVKATVPAGIEGQSYVFITSANGTATDEDILFGPAILEVTPSSPTFDLSI